MYVCMYICSYIAMPLYVAAHMIYNKISSTYNVIIECHRLDFILHDVATDINVSPLGISVYI